MPTITMVAKTGLLMLTRVIHMGMVFGTGGGRVATHAPGRIG